MDLKCFTPEDDKVVEQPPPAVPLKEQARAPAPHFQKVFHGKTGGYILKPRLPQPQHQKKNGPPTSFLAGGPKMVPSGDG
jgi:hypothetical protein